MSATTEQTTGVFLEGDPCPVETALGVDDVAGRILTAVELEREAIGGIAFVRIPTEDGDALVRPRAIVAIVPVDVEEDGEC